MPQPSPLTPHAPCRNPSFGSSSEEMVNWTDPAMKSIHGTNPQNLVEKILRSKIYQNTYWKEQCFGLTMEMLVDKAMELDHLGGTYGGNRKLTPLPHHEDAPNPTREGHHRRVHQERGLQILILLAFSIFFLVFHPSKTSE